MAYTRIIDRHGGLGARVRELIGIPPYLLSCWTWRGAHDKGRPVMWWHRQRMLAYRIVWEHWTGQPCPELKAHHLCENAWCVNPLHIEFITQSTHAKAHGLGGGAHQLAKVKCPSGHDYDDENTYYTRRGHRKCRACNRDRNRNALEQHDRR